MMLGVIAAGRSVEPPGEPGYPNTSYAAGSNVTVTWSQGPGGKPSSYEVWNRAGTTGSFVLKATVAGISAVIPVSSLGVAQFFYVVAKNAMGSAKSETSERLPS